MDDYELDENRNRFSSWAAVTAARASRNCRFTRAEGFLLLSSSGLSRIGTSWDDLPDASALDTFHRQLRDRLCEAADGLWSARDHGFSHGVAAKLINVYLKAMYLSGVEINQAPDNVRLKANALHPPIDRMLLAELASGDVGGRAQFWRKQMNRGWSNFTSEEYESTIDAIRHVTGGPLWKIEKHWLRPIES
ncbi:hypothetical protein HJC03_06135 [Rhizobium sp. NLR4b]|uniref:hypothetical protein n=1 Tax=Rhizobium sp. NLR4b TaxID=2731118 RepID=UPI001C829A02|nr:hypothetical protein [Rhizobium sp. NLR4b]MBX5249980.1 hypothetical protein [Rhizobium sp. NLR4b]